MKRKLQIFSVHLIFIIALSVFKKCRGCKNLNVQCFDLVPGDACESNYLLSNMHFFTFIID